MTHATHQLGLFSGEQTPCSPPNAETCAAPIDGSVVFAVDLSTTAPGINRYWAAWKIATWGLDAFDRYPGEAWPPPPPFTGLPPDTRGGSSRYMMWIKRVNKALGPTVAPGWRDDHYYLPWQFFDPDGELRLAEYLRIAGEQRCATRMDIWLGRELSEYRCSSRHP